MLVIVEDARKVQGHAWGYAKNARAQGAGSIKRDCSVWDELFNDLAAEVGAEYLRVIFVRPGGRGALRKLNADQLAAYTGCNLKGSQHARDAAGVLFTHFMAERENRKK